MRKFFTSIMLLACTMSAVATDYQGTLTVVIDGSVAQPTNNLITLNEQEDGKYELALKNFILVNGGETMPIGNVVLQDIEATTNEQGAIVLETKQDIWIEEGDLEGVLLWMGPLLTMVDPVPVELRAVVSGGGDILTADIKIPLVDQDVQVVFDSRTFQLPNSGFEEFHTATAGKATSDEPNNWHSFMSCTGSFASMVNTVPHTFISEDVRPGSEGSKSVLVKSGKVMGLITANGTLTTGRLKAGSMSATDANNNAFLDLSKDDKDENGDPFYVTLNAMPDSISFWVKFQQGKNASSKYPYATMSAVITDGSYYQEPKPKNTDYSDIIVAEASNRQIESTGEWRKITMPFEYTNNGKLPKGILVTFSTNAEPGQGTGEDELYLDDIELVYNSYLSDLSINGETLPEFASDKYDYEYEVAEGTTIKEAMSNIQYVVASNEAHGIVSVIENKMTIVVLAADLLTSKTYTITFTGGTNDDDDDNNGGDNGDDDDNNGGDNGDDDDNKGGDNGDDDDNKGGEVSVEKVVINNDSPKTIYNIMGQPVNSMRNGEVYIIKYPNGKIVKSINK